MSVSVDIGHHSRHSRY